MDITHRYAWAAGIIDGEGTITIWCKKKKYINHSNCTPNLTVWNSDLKMLKEFVDLFEGKIYKRKSVKNRKQGYTWYLGGHKIKDVIEAIYPFLITKKKHAEIVLEFIKIGKCRGSERLTSERIDCRELLYKNIRKLNDSHYTPRNGR